MIPHLICFPSKNFFWLGMGRETWVDYVDTLVCQTLSFQKAQQAQKIWKFKTETRGQWRIQGFSEGPKLIII